MQKQQFKVQLDDDTVAKLHAQGAAAGGQSGNIWAAQVLTEVARVKPQSGKLWAMLSRLAEECAAESVAPELPSPKRAALPVSR